MEERVSPRLAALLDVARGQGMVLSRSQLYAKGVSRGEVRAQVRAVRWQRVGTQCIALQTGPLTVEGRHWAAVLEAGPRAFLDGTSALIAGGLERFTEDRIRVSVPKGARARRRSPGVDIRETRRWRSEDPMPSGVPRARPAVAAVRGALWARSERQAALILTMTVQQGLCPAEEISQEMLTVRRDRRRAYLHEVLLDLLGGVRSLGELDVLRGCRDRGLPEPEKQALFRASNGRYYLDFRWTRWGVVVEVDGIQHAWAEQLVPDALRQNALAMEGDVVLRIPLLGLRVAEDEFFTQIESALRRAGWRERAA